jgi:hypothetical protein
MADRYYGGQTANWNGDSAWYSDAALTIPAADPTSADDVKFVAGSFTDSGQILTVNSAAYCNDMDWTGALNTPTLTFTTGVILGIYGNCTLINAMVIPTSVNTFIVFYGASNHSLTTNGVTINAAYVGSYSGTGTLTLLDDLNCRVLLLREGGLNTNGKTVTGSNFYSPYTYVRGLFLGGSTLNFSSIYGWDSSVPTNFTLNAGTSTINVVAAFAGGGQVYNIVNLNGSSHTISGNNTFTTLTFKTDATQTITLTAGSNQTITTPIISGDSTHTHTIKSSAGGSAATLTKAGGGSVSCRYLNLTDITAAPATTWYYDINSVLSNSAGWLPGYATCTPSPLELALNPFAPLLKEKLTPSPLALALNPFAPLLKAKLTPSPLALALNPFAPLLWYTPKMGTITTASKGRSVTSKTRTA